MTRPETHDSGCPLHCPACTDEWNESVRVRLASCTCALAERQRIFDLERRVEELEAELAAARDFEPDSEL